jgi:hypothetical protein
VISNILGQAANGRSVNLTSTMGAGAGRLGYAFAFETAEMTDAARGSLINAIGSGVSGGLAGGASNVLPALTVGF